MSSPHRQRAGARVTGMPCSLALDPGGAGGQLPAALKPLLSASALVLMQVRPSQTLPGGLGRTVEAEFLKAVSVCSIFHMLIKVFPLRRAGSKRVQPVYSLPDQTRALALVRWPSCGPASLPTPAAGKGRAAFIAGRQARSPGQQVLTTANPPALGRAPLKTGEGGAPEHVVCGRPVSGPWGRVAGVAQRPRGLAAPGHQVLDFLHLVGVVGSV